MKYHYFVSYQFVRTIVETDTGAEIETGYGNCEVSKESPIFDINELWKVSDHIKELNNYKSLVILNWRRFEQAE